MSIFIRWGLSTVAVMIVLNFVSGIGAFSLYASFIIALVLGLLSTFMKQILIFSGVPFSMATFIIGLIVLNIFAFWFLSTEVPLIFIVDFAPAITAIGVLTIAMWFIQSLGWDFYRNQLEQQTVVNKNPFVKKR